MIGQLRGRILDKQPPQLLFDVAGVGYELEASMNTFYQLPETNQEITLFTHFVVREDAQLLYAFHDKQERALFRVLIKVNGVGPKLALTILSSIDPAGFVRCVNDNDTASLVKLPGVGKKTAERLIVEMRDKLGGWQQSSKTQSEMATLNVSIQPSASQEAIAALISLGYKPQEASRLVAKIDETDLTSEAIIREALKQAL